MRQKTLQYVRLAHKRLMADDNELKQPSPWFGELYAELKGYWDEKGETEISLIGQRS